MTSHFHLELQVADVPLSKIMQRIALRYVQWFNWRHHKTGHLFERRYKAILVDTDEYLRLLTSAARDARSFEVRALAAWAVLQFSGATLNELAKYCDHSTASCATRRIEEWQPVRPDLADKMAQLRSVLTHHPAPTPRQKGIEVRTTPSTDA